MATRQQLGDASRCSDIEQTHAGLCLGIVKHILPLPSFQLLKSKEHDGALAAITGALGAGDLTGAHSVISEL